MFGIINNRKRMYQAQVEKFEEQRKRIKELEKIVFYLQNKIKNNIREKENKYDGISIENIFLLDHPSIVRQFAMKIDGRNILDTLKITIIIDDRKEEMYEALDFLIGIAKKSQRNNF